MSNTVIFYPPTASFVVGAGLSGIGSIADPIKANVDGVTIEVNGSNELAGVNGGNPFDQSLNMTDPVNFGGLIVLDDMGNGVSLTSISPMLLTSADANPAHATSLSLGGNNGTVAISSGTHELDMIAGVITWGGTISSTGFQNTGILFAALPGSPTQGMTALVTDCSVTSGTVSGGGSTHANIVVYTGSLWTVFKNLT